jgi:hypothetical protein
MYVGKDAVILGRMTLHWPGRMRRIFFGRNLPGTRRVQNEERFLAAQPDTFAGANVKGKCVGLLRSK